jgi:hypothetical protein
VTLPPDPVAVAAKKRKKNPPMAAALGDADVDIEDFILRTTGIAADPNVSDSIIDGEILLTIEGAPQITVTVHDQERHILKSEALWDSRGRLRALDVLFDGLWWRLMAIRKTGDDFTLTLELRSVARLRTKMGPRKAASRAKVTRAQYILTLVKAIDKGIPVVIPELTKKQPIAKQKESQAARKRKRTREVQNARDENKEHGFDEGANVAGLDDAQMKRVAEALAEADTIKGATDRVKLAMLVAMAGESEFGNDTGSRGTTFQTLQIPEDRIDLQARHFIMGGRSFRAGGAIGYAKAYPKATIGEIASKVEISDAGAAHYDKHRSRARRLLSAWYGGDGTFSFDEEGGQSSSNSVTLYKRYEYKVDKKESYLDAIDRMAREVQWRAFFSVKSGKATFYYISEKRLMRQRALYRVSEDTTGVSTIDFEENYRKRVQKATIMCRIDRWKAPPGTVVVIEDLNPDGSQRYLVESIRRSLFSPEAEIVCKRPMDSKREPATETYEKTLDDSEEDTDGKRGSIAGDTKGLVDDMYRFLQEVAGNTTEDITVSSGRRNDPGSNHNSGHAADIEVGGDARSNPAAYRKGDNICTAVLVTCGMSRRDAEKIARTTGHARTNFTQNQTWRGWSVEVGWRTLEGGNHFNHVHVGFDNRRPQGSGRSAKPKPSWDRRNPDNR